MFLFNLFKKYFFLPIIEIFKMKPAKSTNFRNKKVEREIVQAFLRKKKLMRFRICIQFVAIRARENGLKNSLFIIDLTYNNRQVYTLKMLRN